MRQKWNVGYALAEWRHLDGHHIEAIEKVFAKCALVHFLAQVNVGSGDDTDIHANGFRAAHALELALLQDAEKFGLQFERQLGDFVQKQSAVVRLLEAAHTLLDGSCEGASDVSEQLGFEEIFGKGAAVHRHHGKVRPGAGLMQSPRHYFFARTRFAGNQNGGPLRARQPDHVLDIANGTALANQEMLPTLGLGRLCRISRFPQMMVLRCCFQMCRQLVAVERAAHEMVRAEFCQADGVGYRAFRVADQNRYSRVGVLNRFEQFRRLPGGQWKFRKNHVSRFCFEACQRFTRAVRHLNDEGMETFEHTNVVRSGSGGADPQKTSVAAHVLANIDNTLQAFRVNSTSFTVNCSSWRFRCVWLADCDAPFAILYVRQCSVNLSTRSLPFCRSSGRAGQCEKSCYLWFWSGTYRTAVPQPWGEWRAS